MRLMQPARTLDTMFIGEKASIINSPTAEQLARELWGGHEALAACEGEDDVKKPRNAGKEWRSKVDWEAVERINPKARAQTGVRIRGLEMQINEQRQQDASFEALRAKLQTRATELEKHV